MGARHSLRRYSDQPPGRAADGACTLLLELLASPAASVSLQAAWALANLALQAVMPKILEQPSVVPTLLAVAGRCHDDPSTSGLLKQVLRCLPSRSPRRRGVCSH